jgi:hypothetical protein
MRPLAVAEVRPPAAYEAVRVEALRHMLDQRLSRSIAVGDLLTLLFENRVTVAGAVEEQLRAAQIEEPERIAEEVALFNALIPGEREVAGTLFVETEEQCAAIAGGGEVVVCCDHPEHRARTVLDEAQRHALAEDLGR